jgi:hypothetical protein
MKWKERARRAMKRTEMNFKSIEIEWNEMK